MTARSLALVLATTTGGGCMAVTPQLPGTDYAALDQVSDRGQREELYQENAIAVHDEPQGLRYTKGTDPQATKRSWQSLDVVLRSDASSAAALPRRSLRLSRLFTALTIACGILTVAGVAASAREGLDLQDINGTGAVLLAGGIATVGFGITAGVFYGRTKTGYQKAVALYNDSLAVRLGINTAAGDYIPPKGVLVDEEGFVILDERERAAIEGDAPKPEPAPAEHGAAPPPSDPPVADPASDPAAPPASDPAAPPASDPAAPASDPAAPPAAAPTPDPAAPPSTVTTPETPPAKPKKPKLQRPGSVEPAPVPAPPSPRSARSERARPPGEALSLLPSR
jgi:hypothetical protein